MYRDNKIGLILPSYNERKLIGPTLDAVPDFVDRIYVVDDASSDNMYEIVEDYMKRDDRIVLIRHEKNTGPGGAVISGYKGALKDDCDISVVAAGDNQMPFDEMPRFLDPIIKGEADYIKGNRFMKQQMSIGMIPEIMPKLRVIGNIIITALTKISSGFYKVADVVDGYTAITKEAISAVNWDKAWKGYGYPMDFLIRMNAYGFKAKDVPRRAIYIPGERQSQIKPLMYVIKVSPMLIKGFLWRLRFRYILLDFHPLVFFYYLSFILLPAGFFFGLKLIYQQFISHVGVSGPQSTLCALLIIAGFQCLLFAMLFDMQEGDK